MQDVAAVLVASDAGSEGAEVGVGGGIEVLFLSRTHQLIGQSAQLRAMLRKDGIAVRIPFRRSSDLSPLQGSLSNQFEVLCHEAFRDPLGARELGLHQGGQIQRLANRRLRGRRDKRR